MPEKKMLKISGMAIAMFTAIVAASASSAEAAQPSAPAVPEPLPIAYDPDHTNLWAGVDVSPSSRAFFGGGVHALNGDLSRDGFLIRESVAFGEYDIDALTATGDDVAFQSANLMVGYQWHSDSSRVAVFVGPDYVRNGDDASPDVRGSSWGVRGIVDVVVPLSNRWDLSGWGTFTTIESQYYAQGRVMYRASDRFRIGPEGALLGGDNWSRQRVGGHAAFGFRGGEFGVSAGHSSGSGDDGLYVNAILSIGI